MEKINAQFLIKVDSSVLNLLGENTEQSFLDKHLFNHIQTDYKIIKSEFDRIKNEEEKEKFDGYIKTIEHFKEDILDSLTYEILEKEKDIALVKVNCSFNYFKNHYTAEHIFEAIVFTKSINTNLFFVEDFKRPIFPQDKIEPLSKIYDFIAKILEEAKSTITITPEKVKKTNLKS